MIKPNSHGIKRALAAHSIHECAGARCPLFKYKCDNSCQDKLNGFALEYIKELEDHILELTQPADVPDEEQQSGELDAHSCAACADDYGICTVCGAIVRGTLADYELHGYDPPESVTWRD